LGAYDIASNLAKSRENFYSAHLGGSETFYSPRDRKHKVGQPFVYTFHHPKILNEYFPSSFLINSLEILNGDFNIYTDRLIARVGISYPKNIPEDGGREIYEFFLKFLKGTEKAAKKYKTDGRLSFLLDNRERFYTSRNRLDKLKKDSPEFWTAFLKS